MKKFLESRFSPAHLIEVRAIRRGDVRRFWITLGEVAALEPTLQSMDGEGWNIFAGVNPRFGRKSDEKTVRELLAFHADIDLGPPRHGPLSTVHRHKKGTENITGTEPDAELGVSVLSVGFFGAEHRTGPPEAELPEPSVIVNSGHGMHCYWVLDAPIAVSNGNRGHLRAINRGLAVVVGGDAACCDLGRILRVPGFRNHKPPAADVRLMADSGVRYSLELFQPFAIESTRPLVYSAALPESVPAMSAELERRFKVLRRNNGEISLVS